MTHRSAPELLTLHAVRLLGYAATPRIADRFDLPPAAVEEHLLDAQAVGRITYSSFGGDGGWSMTETGRAWGEQRLRAELDQAGACADVEQVHEAFVPYNVTVSELCTAWQLSELEVGDARADLITISAGLASAADALAGFETALTARLGRFAGYHRRFRGALDRIDVDPGWITATDRDSCHRVWFEFHEDLIATLGLTR
ncbi:hypothetical protein [Microlunatus speluncae]|uniref:hypothetical protein n=1 Tax=Microlunatus speluncae TaxID=2594267 RepID=UPI0012665356|nr:hypothetical protein [Microlunatus speluncae]